MNEVLIPEINEYYLLHGTKPSVVEVIEKHGLDFRLNERGMLGRGVYFGEKSTKADQYADEDLANRTGVNQPLYMFVARVLLGSAFICDKIQSYKRPPCAAAGCQKDNCSNKDHPVHNSIIAINRKEGGRLLFREFVIYDLAQSYPEYLVEYERKT